MESAWEGFLEEGSQRHRDCWRGAVGSESQEVGHREGIPGWFPEKSPHRIGAALPLRVWVQSLGNPKGALQFIRFSEWRHWCLLGSPSPRF